MEYCESGMDFSPLFSHGNSIYIEKSAFYKGLGEGVKTVEFVTLLDKKLFFIEAKPSAPSLSNPENKERIAEYFQILQDKFHHSLDLLASKGLGINKDLTNEFPSCFDANKLTGCKLVFLLVIQNYSVEGCHGIRTFLWKKLIALRKIWGIDIVVINSEQAQRKGYIK